MYRSRWSRAFPRKLGIVPCLRQDEPALDDGLRVSREALGSPVARDATLLSCRLDIGLQRCRMAEDAAATGIANVRRAGVNLLRHRSDQAGELGEVAGDDCLAERDIGENAIQRIGRIVIWRGVEESQYVVSAQYSAAATPRASLLPK